MKRWEIVFAYPLWLWEGVDILWEKLVHLPIPRRWLGVKTLEKRPKCKGVVGYAVYIPARDNYLSMRHDCHSMNRRFTYDETVLALVFNHDGRPMPGINVRDVSNLCDEDSVMVPCEIIRQRRGFLFWEWETIYIEVKFGGYLSRVHDHITGV